MMPDYCVAQTVCKKCEKIYFVSKYRVVKSVKCCGERRFVLEGDLIDSSCEFLFQQPNLVWVAHNGACFDMVVGVKFF